MEYFGNIIYDDKLKDRTGTFAIYGAGRFGKKLYEYMELNDLADQVRCFCDRDPALQGTTCKGLPVISPEELMGDEGIHILFGGNYAYEILEYWIDHHMNRLHFLYF